MQGTLLATKLYIPAELPRLIGRPQLVTRLDEGRDRKLILISAPAGFGKTTLLSEWIRQRSIPSAWVTLDPGDNDPVRFWSYLIAALQTLEGHLGEAALSMLDASHPPLPIDTVLTVLINDLATVPYRFVVALDDYHVLDSRAIHDGITFLLEHLPPQMHLAIVTRADPPLPVARLRGYGQLLELREADLRLTPEEAGMFLSQTAGLGLSPEQIAALTARTEGWIAGLQMAAVSMQGRRDAAAFIASFTGSNEYIADYLADEVLDLLPPHVKTFLLQTSILNSLTGPLCDSVTGRTDGAAILAQLRDSNLFLLPLDDERRWYRYHRLFADLLRQRLHQQQADAVPDLHRRASMWYEREGLVGDAIEHTLAAQDDERAARLIEETAEATIMRSEVVTFLRRVDALPDSLVRARPMLCVLHALALLLNRYPLSAIEARLRDAESGTAEGATAGAVAALRAALAIFQGNTGRTLAESQRSLALLPEDRLFLRGFVANNLAIASFMAGNIEGALEAWDEAVQINLKIGNVLIAVGALCNLAGLMMTNGRLRHAEQHLRRALALATDRQGRLLPIAGKVLLSLGELHRERFELKAAEECYEQALELVRRYGEIAALIVYISLARVKQAQGDLTAAQALIQSATSFAQDWDSAKIDDRLVAVSRVRLCIAQGDMESALAWAEKHDPAGRPRAGDIYDVHEAEQMTLARVYLAAGRHQDSLAVLHALLEPAQRLKRQRRVIEISVWQSIGFTALGDDRQAMDALARALALAEPEGFIWPFVEAGPPMARLLYHAVEQDICAQFAGQVLAAFPRAHDPSKTQAAQPEMVEALSEREIEVLRLIAAGLSNQEIARDLVLSLSTVKWHTGNIYGKLGAKNRTQALVRARALGILPAS